MVLKQSTIVSWNVKGIHSPIKRKKIFTALRKAGCLIALLQETHLDLAESMKLAREGFKQAIPSPAIANKNGVVILLHSSLTYKIISQAIDDEGRWAEVVLQLEDRRLHILNIYAPTSDDPI